MEAYDVVLHLITAQQSHKLFPLLDGLDELLHVALPEHPNPKATTYNGEAIPSPVVRYTLE